MDGVALDKHLKTGGGMSNLMSRYQESKILSKTLEEGPSAMKAYDDIVRKASVGTYPDSVRSHMFGKLPRGTSPALIAPKGAKAPAREKRVFTKTPKADETVGAGRAVSAPLM